MEIDPDQLTTPENYRLLIHCVVPRPIAWVSTLARDGTRNLAPFSYFGAVTAKPPTLMLSVGRRRGQLKDTARNLLEVPEAVVHIPHRALAEAMVHTSIEAPPEVDEIALAGLEVVASRVVQPPRLRAAAIAFECRVTQHLPMGSDPNDLFFLRVVRIHLADEYLVDGVPDPSRLRACGRLGGDGYTDTGAPFFIRRP